MLENVYDEAIREFKIYFPFLAEQAVKFYPLNRYEIVFILSGGGKCVYDHSLKTIRNLRDIHNEELSEDEWRAEFAKVLQRKIMQRGFSQRDLAEVTGISYPSICNYVSGKSMPNAYYLEKIAEALGCTSADMCNFE